MLTLNKQTNKQKQQEKYLKKMVSPVIQFCKMKLNLKKKYHECRPVTRNPVSENNNKYDNEKKTRVLK
jgi:hypothetical protein